MKTKKSIEYFFHLFSANIISQLLGVVALSYYTRSFSKDQLALIPATMMLGGLSSLFFNFGIFPFIIKKVPALTKNNMSEVRKIYHTAIVLVGSSAFIISFISFIMANQLSFWVYSSNDFSVYFRVLSFSFVFFGLWQLATFLLRGLSMFKELARITVLQNVTRIILIIAFSFFYKTWGIVFGITISLILSVCMAFFYLKKFLFPFEGFYNIKLLIKESYPFYLEGYIMYLRREGDNLLVTSLLGGESLAVYFIAKKIFLFIFGALSSLSDVLTTQISKFKNDLTLFKDKLDQLADFYIYLLVPFSFYFISFVPFIIKMVGGKQYSEAVNLGTALSVAPVISYFFGLLYGVNVFLLDKSIKRMQITIVDASILLISMLIFGTVFHLSGVVLSRVFAPLLSGVYMIYLSKKIPMAPSFSLSGIIKVIGLSMIFLLPNLFCFFNNVPVLLALSVNIIVLLIAISYIHFFIDKKFYGTLSNVFSINIKDPLSILSKKK